MELRSDLQDLMNFLGTQNLRLGLSQLAINRALEVGVGSPCWPSSASNLSDHFQVINQLVQVLTAADNYSTDNIVAIDPEIYPDHLLQETEGQLCSYTRSPISIEQMSQQVSTGQTQPFDLIISRGLACFSFLIELEEYKGPEWVQERTLELVKYMATCLNPLNPCALIVLSDITDFLPFPFSDYHLDSLGLKRVYGIRPTPPPATEYLEEDTSQFVSYFQHLGLLPANFTGYSRLILASK